MPAIVEGFKNNQKIRVIINDVVINTTIKNAFNTIGNANHRIALSIALAKMFNLNVSSLGEQYGPNNIQVNLQ
jgi:hypothetical protein